MCVKLTRKRMLEVTYVVRFLLPLGWRSVSSDGVKGVDRGEGEEGSPALLHEEPGRSWAVCWRGVDVAFEGELEGG